MPWRSARSATINNDYLPTVRAQLEKELRIPPEHVMINASHCHGIVCADVAERTIAGGESSAAKISCR